MAKLSANGNEVFKMVKESGETETCLWTREEYSFRSNGKVLHKYTVKFKQSYAWEKEGGRLHNYGWKQASKWVQADQQGYIDRLTKKGWALV